MEDALVTIAQFDDYIPAELAKQKLADHDIEAIVLGDNTANVYSGLGFAKVELQVQKKFAGEAINILQSSDENQED
jgi:hypothetical protein